MTNPDNKFVERFNELMESLPESKASFADKLGVSKSIITLWQSGQRSPKQPTIREIARLANVSYEWLFGFTDEKTEYHDVESPIKRISELQPQKIPLVGKTAAGVPVYEEYTDVYVTSPVEADFALVVYGDSMSPMYEDKDIVYFKVQNELMYDGQIAVISVDDEVTLKKVYRQKEGLLLLSINTKFPPMLYDPSHDFRILGIPVGYTRMFKR